MANTCNTLDPLDSMFVTFIVEERKKKKKNHPTTSSTVFVLSCHDQQQQQQKLVRIDLETKLYRVWI